MKKIKQLLGVDLYHKKGLKGDDIKIAIIDDGCYDHPDIKKPIHHINHQKVFNNGHGTHVLGIIHNICPKAEIFDIPYDNKLKSLASAIRKAIELDVEIINLSQSCDGDYLDIGNDNNKENIDQLYQLYQILESKGILIVISAGNQHSVNHGYQKMSLLTQDNSRSRFDYHNPIYYQHWPIVVSSCELPSENQPIKISDFNSINRSIDCISYGDNIWSWSKKSYLQKSGTSMAVPQVVGCLALLLQSTPKTNKVDMAVSVRKILLDKCTKPIFKLPKIGQSTLNSQIKSDHDLVNKYITLAVGRGLVSLS